jgi:hypothetical protein
MATFDEHSKRPTLFLEEGAFTRNEEVLTDQGLARGGTFANQIFEGIERRLGSEVGICPAGVSNQVAAGTADNTVCILGTGVIPIGRVAGPIIGDLPRQNAAAGTFTRRKAAIEIDGKTEYIRLKGTALLEAGTAVSTNGNAAITPGMYLGVVVSGGHDAEYDKMSNQSTATNVIAMETRAANAAGYLRVFRPFGQVNVQS